MLKKTNYIEGNIKIEEAYFLNSTKMKTHNIDIVVLGNQFFCLIGAFLSVVRMML